MALITKLQNRYQKFKQFIPSVLILYAIYLILLFVFFILSGAPLIEENVPDNYTAIPPIILLVAAALFPLILFLGLLLLNQKYDAFLKFVGGGLIIYFGYIILIFYIFLSSESYILLSQSIPGENYSSPLLLYLPAISIPIIIPILALEFKFRLSVATSEDKTTIMYLIVFLFLQVSISVLLFLCYTLVFRYPISEFTNIAEDFTFPSWLVGILFSMIQVILSFFLVWRWENSKLPQPSLFHWSVAYSAYIFLYGGLVALFAFFDPSLWQTMISAPNITTYLLGFAAVFFLLPSFSFIITSYRVLALLFITLFPDVTGESAFGLVFIFLGLFLITLIFIFPFAPLILFYFELTLIKRSLSRRTKELEKRTIEV